MPIEVPRLNAPVIDLTNTLSQFQQRELSDKLRAIEQAKGSQIALLIVPTTGEERIEQYGIRVAEQWQLGRQGVDDGVLLLIAKNDKAVRIEVGRGLEGVLPDVIASRIIREVIVPAFKSGDIYVGIDSGIDQISSRLSTEIRPAAMQPKAERFSIVTPLAFLIGIFIAFISWALVGPKITIATLIITTFGLASYAGATPRMAGVASTAYALVFGLIVLLTRAVQFLNRADSNTQHKVKSAAAIHPRQRGAKPARTQSSTSTASLLGDLVSSVNSSSSNESSGDNYSGAGGSFGGGGASGSWS